RRLQDAGRKRRVRADEPGHLGERDVLVRKSLTNPQRDLGQRRQLELVRRKGGLELLDERRAQSPRLVELIAHYDGVGIGHAVTYKRAGACAVERHSALSAAAAGSLADE